MSTGLGYTVPELIKGKNHPNFAKVCGRTCGVLSFRAAAKSNLPPCSASWAHSPSTLRSPTTGGSANPCRGGLER